MSRNQMIAEARAAGQAARQNLQWMDKHPDRFNKSKEKDMRKYLKLMIHFSKMEIKNTRSAKRAFVASFKGLIASIIPQPLRKVKG